MKRNQFGGTLGGPLVKNKLHFFGGFQGTTLRQDPSGRIAFVPTPAMLAGDWTAVASPACNAGRTVTLRAPFVNNRIDPALFSRAAVNIATKLPAASNPCGQVTYGQRNQFNDAQYIGRIDYVWTDSHSVFARYMATATEFPHPFSFTPDNILNVAGVGTDNLAQSITVGHTYVLGPSLINSFRVTVNRVADTRSTASYFGPSDIGINAYSYIPKALGLSVTSGFTLTGSNTTLKHTTYEVSDSVSLVLRKHHVSFGGSVARSSANNDSNSAPNFVFNGQATGLGMADFLTGRVSTLGVVSPNPHHMRQWQLGFYGQDNWRVTSRLMMNYGLRWDPFLPQVSTNGRVYNFDYDRFRQDIRSTVFRNAPPGFYYPGDPGFPGRSGINKRWLNIAPRIGLAWDVQGDGQTSVRASYGLSYVNVPLQWRTGAGRVAPWAANISLSAIPFDDPWRDYPGGDPLPLNFDQNAVFPIYSSYETTPYDIHPTYVSSWNLGIQRQIGRDWVTSTSYLGSQAVHVWIQKPLNPAIYIPGASCTLNGVTYNPCSSTANTNQRRRLSLETRQSSIGILDEFDDGGTQTYGGLLVSIRNHAGRSVTLGGNYTWSHCIGDYSNTNGTGPVPGTSFLVADNRDLDRVNRDSDRRHIFNLTVIAETPQFAGPVLRLLSGWRASAIYRRSSGGYLTITTDVDRALTGIAGQRANQILGNPYQDKSGRPGTNFLNPAAFALPATGMHGTMGRANVEGPTTWQLDAALSKEFRIRESQSLELRAEAYNVLNRFRAAPPASSLQNVFFGRIRASLDPRVVQFALRYAF